MRRFGRKDSVGPDDKGGASNVVIAKSVNDAEILYTDVVIVGNGPSGICLSYLLSGNWPYYNGNTHSNEFLQLRLKDGGDQSIIEQELDFLSDGLEGRSPNPVGLLFDALTHPDADMGIESPTLVDWKKCPEKAVPHVVLGKCEPGGAWQMMEGGMQTLSLGNWMSLPDMPFKEWMKDRQSSQESDQTINVRKDRACMEDVRQYYMEYVKHKKLSSNFKNHMTVTSIEKVLDVKHSIDDESGEQNPCCREHYDKLKWEVRGRHLVSEDAESGEIVYEEFCYRTKNVVIATGTYDLPNRLWVPGEQQPYILHSLGDMESLIKAGSLTPESDPVLVVGAGLSAADTILCAQHYNIPVIHAFRRDIDDPNIILKKLPRTLYPEYQSVLQMMNDSENYEKYTSYSSHQIVEFKDDGKVIIRGKNSSGSTLIQVSYAMIMIGSRPDLSFLPQEGKNLGVVPGLGIDCKHNPIDVNPYTYQSISECGIFAMGPLVGDNFVRFLKGGSLAITSHIIRKQANNL